MIYTIVPTNKMKRDTKLMAKRGKDMTKLSEVLNLLTTGKPLPEKYRDHALKGNMRGSRECHIEGDWLLVYERHENNLIVLTTGTGTHSDLLGM